MEIQAVNKTQTGGAEAVERIHGGAGFVQTLIASKELCRCSALPLKAVGGRKSLPNYTFNE